MDFDEMVPHIINHVFRKAGPDWRVWESQVSDHEMTYTINEVEYELESGDLLYLTEGDTVDAVTNPRNLIL